MKKNNVIFDHLVASLKQARSSLQAAERWSEKLGSSLDIVTADDASTTVEIHDDSDNKIIEGVFDGQKMISGQEEYTVPVNYASKSKLIQGDRLKLTITADGSFIYKQLELLPRATAIGVLVLNDNGSYQVLVNTKAYNVLTASVTFLKGKIGDKVAILLPEKNSKATWAAIDNLIPS